MSQVLNWWNRIFVRPESDLVRTALTENVEMARAGKACWARDVHTCLSRLDHDLAMRVHQMQPVQVQDVLHMMTSIWEANAWRATDTMRGMDVQVQAETQPIQVRQVPSNRHEGFKLWTYRQ